ncbi:asparagine synthase (glutamine-hydrolyzing) [Trifolium repens]|nr:asparagine synthase (glutamine-hydrolyzing) [Trifolium repens]
MMGASERVGIQVEEVTHFVHWFKGRCIDALEEVIYRIETYDVTTISKSIVYAREFRTTTTRLGRTTTRLSPPDATSLPLLGRTTSLSLSSRDRHVTLPSTQGYFADP